MSNKDRYHKYLEILVRADKESDKKKQQKLYGECSELLERMIADSPKLEKRRQ